LEVRDSFENKDPHGTLPQQYAPLVYGIVQAAITTAVATAIATLQLTDFNMRFVEEWLLAWGVAFLTMLPVIDVLVWRVSNATDQSRKHRTHCLPTHAAGGPI
jgi:Protein of unknown function (DUF2798)